MKRRHRYHQNAHSIDTAGVFDENNQFAAGYLPLGAPVAAENGRIVCSLSTPLPYVISVQHFIKKFGRMPDVCSEYFKTTSVAQGNT